MRQTSTATTTPPQGQKHLRLLLIGPANPLLVGGAAVLFRQLVAGLGSHADVSVCVVDSHSYSGSWRAIASSCIAAAQMSFKIASCDVVAFHASIDRAKWFGPYVWLLCKLFRKPWIFRGFGGTYDLAYERMWPPMRWVFRRTLLRADTVLFQTKALVEVFHQRGFENVRWYPNSRPLPKDGPMQSHERTGPRRFVFVGRIEPSKGIREIVAAAKLLCNEATVDLYGPLVGQIRENELAAANVHWHGVLPADQVIEKIRPYDALLLPTYYEGEGYPGVILEAFAAGVPVIATRWRAIPEIVDEICGLLIEPRSAESLAEAMRKLIQSPELMNSLRGGAWERAQPFSAGLWTDEFVELVRALATGSDGR